MVTFREDVETAIQARLLMIVPDDCVDAEKLAKWATSIASALPPQVYRQERIRTEYAIQRDCFGKVIDVATGSEAEVDAWLESYRASTKQGLAWKAVRDISDWRKVK